MKASEATEGKQMFTEAFVASAAFEAQNILYINLLHFPLS